MLKKSLKGKSRLVAATVLTSIIGGTLTGQTSQTTTTQQQGTRTNQQQGTPSQQSGTTTQPTTAAPSTTAAPTTNAAAPLNTQQQGTQTTTTQQTTTTTGTTAPQTTGAPVTGTTGIPAPSSAGQGIGTSSGIAPAELPQEPPPVAPNYEAPARPLPSAERIGVRLDEQQPLTLNDAVRLALENNNDIGIARIDVQLAEFDLTAAQGVYDPIINSSNYFERSATPTSSVITGGPGGRVTETDLTGQFGVNGFSPFAGGLYSLNYTSSRLTSDARIVQFNPQFPSVLTATYQQPLLRGFRFDNRRRTIEVAKKNLSLTDAQFRGRTIEIIAQVESAYWDLAFALRNLQVQIDAVRQARTQVESNQRQVRQGTLAPIDIVAADTQVTNFEQSVYTAQEQVTRSENFLKTLLLGSRTAPFWSRPLVPITPVDLEPPRTSLEDAVAAARANRPELAQLDTSADINRINQRFFRDQRRPQIDLVGSFTPSGLAGTPRLAGTNPFGNDDDQLLRDRVNELSQRAGLPALIETPTANPINEQLIGGYGRSVTNLFGLNYPTARVGVVVSLPFRNRTAEANYGRSLAEARRIESQRAQQEQTIEAEVRNTLQTLRSVESRLASAAASRSSAEQQYASEQRRFAAGTSTVFLVLQRQQELVAARANELLAQTTLNKSIAEFQRVTGRTLEANNVAIEARSREFRPANPSVPTQVMTTPIFADTAPVALPPIEAAIPIAGANSFTKQQ